MSKAPNAYDWFWLADDGRIFGSGAGKTTSKPNAAYKAWIEDGSVATPWPRDDKGDQTDAALNAVLSPYGLSAGATVPVEVTNFQAHAALMSAGLDDLAQAVITAIKDDTQRKLAQLAFDRGSFLRSSPLVAQLGTALKLTSAQIDDLFIAAAKIVA